LIESPLLHSIPWLEHGFGTRDSTIDQDAMASLQQIHSSKVIRVSQAGCAGEADALITTIPGVAVSIRTADCIPILLVDVEHRAIAAIHAGWRGTAGKITGNALGSLREAFGSLPGRIVAAIGPGIGECCYAVGAEVAREFGLDQATHLDLARLNREQLVEAGVPAGQIDTIGGCTFCESQKFFSYRREREQAGRMISFVRIQRP